jgi:hypothetical protein
MQWRRRRLDILNMSTKEEQASQSFAQQSKICTRRELYCELGMRFAYTKPLPWDLDTQVANLVGVHG